MLHYRRSRRMRSRKIAARMARPAAPGPILHTICIVRYGSVGHAAPTGHRQISPTNLCCAGAAASQIPQGSPCRLYSVAGPATDSCVVALIRRPAGKQKVWSAYMDKLDRLYAVSLRVTGCAGFGSTAVGRPNFRRIRLPSCGNHAVHCFESVSCFSIGIGLGRTCRRVYSRFGFMSLAVSTD